MKDNLVLDFAREQCYYTAKEAGSYNGYTVYIPEMKNDEIAYTGFPQFILVKGNEIIMHTDDRFEVYDEITFDNEEDLEKWMKKLI